MNAIILAAGLGRRLGLDLPKALVKVAGRSLLEWQLAWVRPLVTGRIVVVGGFRFDELRRHALELDPDLTVVENLQFRRQNLYSLLAARDHLAKGFLLMNADHLYPPAMRTRLAQGLSDPSGVRACADSDRPLGPDDMKVDADGDGLVRRISKGLEQWTGGYIGMTFVPASLVPVYLEAAARVADRSGDLAVVEMVLQELADSGTPVRLLDTSGIGWLEVDTPDELAVAEREAPGLLEIR